MTVTATRQAALPGFVVRYLFKVDAKGERQTIIEACRAELKWASADWRRITDSRPFDHEIEQDAAAHRLPHEQAAAAVLNVWGHLHPIEHRIREGLIRLRAQRAAGWHAHALGTVDDIRAYWLQRRAVSTTFHRAVTAYRAARREA